MRESVKRTSFLHLKKSFMKFSFHMILGALKLTSRCQCSICTRENNAESLHHSRSGDMRDGFPIVASRVLLCCLPGKVDEIYFF